MMGSSTVKVFRTIWAASEAFLRMEFQSALIALEAADPGL
jgi:hypothetical protein